ncbi:hypothetical protein H0H87_012464 [Tephrocybe sp. NHM501043]|nr:hypothetical protein H0H87_012464 [Tephrocybe sp. NHM501043]
MFSTLLSLALLAAPALADFAISTPSFVQCQKAAISWDPTNGPYNLIVVAAEDPCGDALFDLGDHDGTSIHWEVALPAGAKVQLSAEDVNGDEAWSGVITVEKSDDASCVPNSVKDLVSTSSSHAASSTTKSASGSTVVITPTTTVAAAETSGTDDTTPSAVGAAANSPLGLGNGASSVRQSTPIVLLGALAAVLAFSL